VEFLTIFHAEFFIPNDFFAAECAKSIFLSHNIPHWRSLKILELQQLPRHRLAKNCPSVEVARNRGMGSSSFCDDVNVRKGSASCTKSP
jgi:hypothetical protein